MSVDETPQAADRNDMLDVLVIEDDFATRRQLLGKLSQDPRMRVELGANVAEGLVWIAQRKFNVILVDLGLPDGSGIAIITAAIQTNPDVSVLVLSAMRDEASVVDAISAGAGGYIVKDASSEDILHAVHNMIEGFSPLSPSIARFILRSFRQRSADQSQLPAQIAENAPLETLHFGLTLRENDVLLEITRGASYKQIARTLSITEATVQSHIKNIYRKLGVSNRSEATYRYSTLF